MDKSSKKTDNSSQSTTYPPVVAVLGHVDHGKTSLLDAIRKTNIAQREHGGITQKIGASGIEVTHEGKKRKITFIDTPGHEAFSKMRGRGAVASDIGILVVSAVDGVMPQTRESIRILLDAKVPIIVALTKADLPTKQVEKVKQQLLKEGVLLEGLGGQAPYLEVSAKQGTNIKELLDLILLAFDLRAPVDTHIIGSKKPLKAVVIESKLDTKAGPKATVVVKNGTIQKKDEIISEGIEGKVKSLITDLGQQIDKADIGDAVEILGFEKVPSVGGVVYRKNDVSKEKNEQADQQADHKLRVQKAQGQESLSILLCADSQGSLEAISQALPVQINVVSQKTGEISEADVLFAKSTGAIILGFNTKLRNEVARLASLERVLLKNYTIIYELLDEVNDVVEGKRLALEEQIYGTAKIQASFPFDKTIVLGVKVLEGRVAKGDHVRLMRGDTAVGEASITSVRQGKNVTSKVEQGQEAGIIISPLLDFTIGDMVICHG